jgi:hypothetical protein
MANEVFVALFDDLKPAEDARREIERAGVPVEDIDLRSQELTGFGSADIAPQPHGLWESLFAREPHYRRHLDKAGGTLLAVRAEGAEYDRIAAILLRHDLRTGHDPAPVKTSESSRVRRYVIKGAETVPLHEDAIALASKP